MDAAPVETPTRTPLLCVTGFLGSGKTTLINRLLRTPGIPRLGVVVNEFGQIGIDGKLLAGTGIMELANGCVCCAKGTEMWEAALELVDRAGAEVLLVETSGLVEPGALLEQYALLPKDLAARVELLGLLCVVDATFARQAVAKRPEAREQIELADRILLSKLDLATPADLRDVHALLDELKATPERTSLSQRASEADIAEFFRFCMAKRSARPRRPAQARVPHRGAQLVAVSVHETAPLLRGPLERLLAELPGEVLRAKGFVRLLPETEAGPPPLSVVHLSGARLFLEPATPEIAAQAPAGSTLVFIGEDLDESWLRLRLSGCRAA